MLLDTVPSLRRRAKGVGEGDVVLMRPQPF
jgi:hypothetical protein